MSDLFSIAGKTALVTGGSRGIGLMIARGFVEAGAKVYISSRKAEVCDEVAAELSKVGEAVSIPANLSTEDECRRLADAIAERESSLDILVNNAGATWGAPVTPHRDGTATEASQPEMDHVPHLPHSGGHTEAHLASPFEDRSWDFSHNHCGARAPRCPRLPASRAGPSSRQPCGSRPLRQRCRRSRQGC